MADSKQFENIEAKREYLLMETMKWSHALTANAYGILRDWALAEDAFQETLIEVSRKASEFEEGRAVLPWVRQIIKFKSLNIYRKHSREQTGTEERLIDLVDSTLGNYLQETPLSTLNQKKAALEACLSRLDKRMRDLLLSFYADGDRCEVLAQRMQKTVNAIYVILNRLRVKLRQCITSYMRGVVQ
ncbi:MAG: sigma-70 family RNA polymerase sigma factor [Verrucomicrobiota bacterium]